MDHFKKHAVKQYYQTGLFHLDKHCWKKPKLKCSNATFWGKAFFILALSTNSCPQKMTCLVTLYDKLQVSKNRQNHQNRQNWQLLEFYELLATHDVAGFARNVECDFLGDFQTLLIN